ncbi:MAG: UDP-3-O-(3-hydroxymyristoyl)glucosamine N-acyltransferase [Bacteroidetes bacterium RIFOXYA12_FULL_35_11]|nr:MAG: UDP-3-O-(3-hydroxymyristoyl)glucosamine N-acyltransferase [Bacteroidetes bacterium GWF2_35_48]OFY73702.1 MAG: UDP-3-O-(3-hydroxymyristoyl)glucosamine N-acyltransferase [Bacteroidetes bacterium RIFOXYA12_FULL_35_11]OFY92790.1 MAG: UDP-3-O-(3-hydroxymyristoyl)glucosamine N-acyltransferase [Bacteroidetes bacterium RIFOXYC12_FULL_35_7]OFY96659.1 MAG: UDP-3-O-(3-hydroxymyristoyl)glucosamine N-acyltransferase [Bacteroidetes bacterium RIFOXYB2_FULL_35_7]HBX52898.1 UDP-3-O-(3-hydroxymyristoyl)g
MEFTAKAIATFLKGNVEGNPEAVVTTVSKIEEGKPGSLCFLANPQYTHFIYTTEATIVLVNNNFKAEKPVAATLIRVENAYEAFASLLELYNQSLPQPKGIDKMTFIDESAIIGENIYLGAFAYIGKNVKIGNNVKIYPQVFIGENVQIGDNTILYAGVKIYHACVIGSDCILHSGVVIGADGFGFAMQSADSYKKVPQIGNVVIEDKVEVGANTTIDRATIGSTIIRKGVKFDNLIQIAHNVEIGENTVICAQTGISGSTKIGKKCMIAGQVGVIGHISIADEVKIAAQSGIGTTIKEKGIIVQGSPSFNIHEYQKSYVLFKQLPQLRKQILELQKEIKNLKESK